MTKAENKKIIKHICSAVLGILSVFALVIFFLVAIYPAIRGYDGYVITSNSMAPTLQRFDVVFVEPTAFDDIEERNIVAFKQGESVTIHRVFDIDAEERLLATKGDATTIPDDAPIHEDWVLGRLVYRVPLVGFLKTLWM